MGEVLDKVPAKPFRLLLQRRIKKEGCGVGILVGPTPVELAV